METITAGGITFPKLGLGTYRLQGDACRAAVASALALGYRHIDTAEMYGNEEAVGAALSASGIARADLHVTTKVWWQNLAPDAMRAAMRTSLDKLGLDHVDLYLIHWPAPDMVVQQAIETLIGLRDAGHTRAVGVSNFPSRLWHEAVRAAGPGTLACDQVEYHVLRDQSALTSALRADGAALVAHVPLAQGRLADYPQLETIARKHGATAAQIALKWLLDQDGVAAIPKAGNPANQAANLAALKVTLDDEDRATIAALPKDQRFVTPAFAPAWD